MSKENEKEKAFINEAKHVQNFLSENLDCFVCFAFSMENKQELIALFRSDKDRNALNNIIREYVDNLENGFCILDMTNEPPTEQDDRFPYDDDYDEL